MRRNSATNVPDGIRKMETTAAWFANKGFAGVSDSRFSWKNVGLVYLRKPDASAVKGIRGLWSCCARVDDGEVVLVSKGGGERLRVGAEKKSAAITIRYLLQKHWQWRGDQKVEGAAARGSQEQVGVFVLHA